MRAVRPEAVLPFFEKAAALCADSRRREVPVKSYLQLGRGRKKAVKQFTVRHGLWIVIVVTTLMIVISLLFMIGVFRVDSD
jgi:hypothetical protein